MMTTPLGLGRLPSPPSIQRRLLEQRCAVPKAEVLVRTGTAPIHTRPPRTRTETQPHKAFPDPNFDFGDR